MSNFHEFYSNLRLPFCSIVGASNLPIQNDYFPIDLSQDSQLIKFLDLTNPVDMERLINDYLRVNNKKVAYGGYLEHRNLYKRSSYFNKQEENERNIHLGVDFWCSAGTEVFAPLMGSVHSFQNNTNFGDYGPTLILSHQLNGFIFYTLYGHLSMDSLTGLEVGKVIEKGDCIARLGVPEINGEYAPHLHFQVIVDIQNKYGDYPGVCAINDLDFYKSNCLNPLILLGL